MKKTKIVASVLAFVVIGSMYSVIAFAASKYIMVNWFNQPEPSSSDKYWKEQTNGQLDVVALPANGVTTIAYVPVGYTIESMPKDFDVTVDLVIPDVNEFPDSWAGFYIRAKYAQSGTGGYVIHMNSDGLAVFDGESGTPVIEERIKPELFRVSDWNRIRATLIDKELKVWVNGVEAYTYKNCMTGTGFLGLTSINYKGKFRNYKFTADSKNSSEAFIVAGTSGAIKPPAATSVAASSETVVSVNNSSVAASSEVASSESISSETASSVAASSEETVSAASDEQSGDDTGSGNMTTIIIIIAAVIVIGGGIAGFIIARKKRQ